MTPSEYFQKLAASLPQLQRDIANTVIAVEAENQWAQNFRQGGFIDTAFTPWKPRKADTTDGWESRTTDPNYTPNHALLVKTSTLKGHALKGRVIDHSVEFSFPLPYEKIHNEGGIITGTCTVKGYTRKNGVAVKEHTRTLNITIPKRQFIGESHQLNQRIQQKATQFLNKHLSNL
jgi:hypothetical protein